MHRIVLGIIFIAEVLLISPLQASRSSTCGELETEIRAQLDEIVNLKLQLEKYKLADDSCEELPDECNRLESCSKCIREETKVRCGWCFLSNRCSLKENCHGSGSQFWISNGIERCPKIRAVKPHLVASVSAEMLDVIIPHIPQYNKSLICSFEMLGTALFTKGRITDKGVSCPSPRTDQLLPIPHDRDYVPVTLSVQVPNRPSFVSTTNFTIFDCRRYTSCSDCTSSPFPCAWCSAGNRCTHDVDENCRNDNIIYSKAVPKPSIRQGPNYCTRILPNPIGNSNEIYIPSGLKMRIHVKVENILRYQVSMRYYCKIKGHSRVTGTLLGDVIYCDAIKFQALGRSPISNLSIDIYLEGDIKLDNPQKLQVVVFHCSRMASSCGECLDLPSQYNCGWCDESYSCTLRDGCEESEWLRRNQRCTKPDIFSFYPKTGIFTRPTNITIKGINLGKEFKDIYGGVRLINEESEFISECRPFEDLYIKPNQIVCELDVPEIVTLSNGSMQGFFEVKVNNDYVTISGEEYFFVYPSITGLEPVKGIKSGGTYLTIHGNHLDAGNKVEAFVGDIPCAIVSRESSKIQCITSPSPRIRSNAVRVIFDGEERKSSTYFFYLEDPYIRSVKSEFNSDGPTGTPSGGNQITVEGEYLDHVQNSHIYVIVDKEEYPGTCMVESSTEMKCLSPRVPPEVLNFCGEEGFLSFDYGFKMGYLEEVQNISMRKRFSKFHMHPDPFFKSFADDSKIKAYKSDYLVIEGRNLDSTFNENDITVEIGADECSVTSLSPTRLTCRPPPTQPEARDGDPNKLPEVVVKVRGTQEYFIGFLRYDI